MPYDSFTVTAVVNELNKTLSGGKINKVLQPEKDEAVLFIYAKKNYRLLLSCGAVYPRLHLTDTIKENPETPYAFCMNLRKYLTGGTIISFTQLPYDRIVTLTIENTSEMFDKTQYKLIIEIMGRQSNIILCDNNLKILSSLKTVPIDSSSRTILPGLKYTYPESDKIKADDTLALTNALYNFQGEPTTAYLTSNFMGLSTVTAEHILSQAKNNCGEIAKAFTNFDQKVKNAEYNPCILKTKDTLIDYYIFPYNDISSELVFYDTISQCLDAFYSGKDKGKNINDKKRFIKSALKTALKKTEKKMAILKEKLEECKQAQTFKKYGELITANIYKIKKLQNSITVQDYYNDNKNIVIPIDENLSPSQNAQKYYKKYNKLKNAKEQSTEQLVFTQERYRYLLSVEDYLNNSDSCEEFDEIKEELIINEVLNRKKTPALKNKKTAPYILKKELDNFTIYCGKNNIQNDYITFKLAKPNDMWLHAKNVHGAHVIIKTLGKDIPESVLLFAAKQAAGVNTDRAEVDYTLKKYVKKPSGAKPGFVIYTDYKTITVKN